MSDEIQQGRSQESPSLACSNFERAAQICRYYLKHQNHPSRWDDKSDYEQGVQIACENLAALMLEEAGKFKVEVGSSLEELAEPAMKTKHDKRAKHTDNERSEAVVDVSRLVRFRELLEMEISEQLAIANSLEKDGLTDIAERSRERATAICFVMDYFCDEIPEAKFANHQTTKIT